MKYLKLFTLLALMAAFGLVSCSEDTTTGPDTTKPDKITNLVATSLNDSTVSLKWSVSASESSSLFTGYQVNVLNEDGQNISGSPDTLAKGTNMLSVQGLNAGTVYTFLIRGKFSNGNLADSVYIKWSPAFRFDMNTNDDDVLKVYELASSFGSGLQLFDADTYEKSVARTVGNGAKWDLGFYFSAGNIKFGSASAMTSMFNFSQAPGVTEMFATAFEANSLDEVYDSRSMNDGSRNTQYDATVFDLTSLNQNSGVVFYVRKKTGSDYNYAKVLIKKNPSGTGFIQGEPTNRYIEVAVSYQKKTNVPYAKIGVN